MRVVPCSAQHLITFTEAVKSLKLASFSLWDCNVNFAETLFLFKNIFALALASLWLRDSKWVIKPFLSVVLILFRSENPSTQRLGKWFVCSDRKSCNTGNTFYLWILHNEYNQDCLVYLSHIPIKKKGWIFHFLSLLVWVLLFLSYSEN